ncbi:MAG: hydantoinase B/oxoprolinase family protein [Armatimonadetes bacterium]|nr:hydantoinase B/oxoprolinase family protein [Armatimonadota bacterium]
MARTMRRRTLNIEIAWARLMSIIDESATALLRTAFSTIISGAQDFACQMLDTSARALAHSTKSVAEFAAIMPITTRHLLRKFPPETLRPGDVLTTNDPWLCAGHLGDIVIVVPVFHRKRLVAFMAALAHMPDIGGTLDDTGARDVHEEGLWIPPAMLYEAGRPNTLLQDIIAHNVRVPEAVLGDVEAEIAACHVGATRLIEFMKEFDLVTLEPIAEDLQRRAEATMREAIRRLPDGVYRQEMLFDGVAEEPLRICLRLEVRGDGVHADYDGTSPQVRAGINSAWNFTYAETVNAIKSVLCPSLPSTEGLFRPITVAAPERSILNALPPAPVKGRTRTGFHVPSIVFAALAEVAPDFVQAGTGVPNLFVANGIDEQGRRFNAHMLTGGGKGATARGDGIDCCLYPTSSSNIPIEIYENRCPFVVEQTALLPDSGGAGRHRGGCGQEIVLRVHPAFTQPVNLSMRVEMLQQPALGLFGGRPGGLARIVLNGRQLRRSDQEVIRGGTVLAPGERIVIVQPGGGGYGPPAERDPRALVRDLRHGLVTPEGATRDYGFIPEDVEVAGAR